MKAISIDYNTGVYVSRDNAAEIENWRDVEDDILDALESYLRSKIDNFYYEIYLNGGITGHMLNITTCGPNNEHLLIRYVENHGGGHPMYDIVSECEIPYYSNYTPGQLYDFWQDSH